MRRGSGAGHSAADPQQTARLKTTLEDSGILVQETALSPRSRRLRTQSHESLLEQLDERYWGEGFDAAGAELARLPPHFDQTTIEDALSDRISCLEVVSERLSRHVLRNWKRFVEGINEVATIATDLEDAHLQAKSARSELAGSIAAVGSSIAISRRVQRRSALTSMLAILERLQQVSVMRRAIREASEEGEYEEAFWLCAESSRALLDVRDLRVAAHLAAAIDEAYAEATVGLQLALQTVCSGFRAERCAKVLAGYHCLGDSSQLGAEVMTCFSNAVATSAMKVVRGVLLTRRGLEDRVAGVSSLQEAVKLLPSELFRTCLARVLMVLFDIMASHWAMMSWHNEQLAVSASALVLLHQARLDLHSSPSKAAVHAHAAPAMPANVRGVNGQQHAESMSVDAFAANGWHGSAADGHAGAGNDFDGAQPAPEPGQGSGMGACRVTVELTAVEGTEDDCRVHLQLSTPSNHVVDNDHLRTKPGAVPVAGRPAPKPLSTVEVGPSQNDTIQAVNGTATGRSASPGPRLQTAAAAAGSGGPSDAANLHEKVAAEESWQRLLLTVRQALGSGRRMLWDDAARRLAVLLTAPAAFAAEHFTQVLEWTQAMLKIGEAFSGEPCTSLRDAVQRQSGRFFQAFHFSNMVSLHSILGNELWNELPAGAASVPDLAAAISEAEPPSPTFRAPEGSHKSTAAADGFEYWARRGNPWRQGKNQEPSSAHAQRGTSPAPDPVEESLGVAENSTGAEAVARPCASVRHGVMTNSSLRLLRWMVDYAELMSILKEDVGALYAAVSELFEMYLLHTLRAFADMPIISIVSPTESQGGGDAVPQRLRIVAERIVMRSLVKYRPLILPAGLAPGQGPGGRPPDGISLLSGGGKAAVAASAPASATAADGRILWHAGNMFGMQERKVAAEALATVEAALQAARQGLKQRLGSAAAALPEHQQLDAFYQTVTAAADVRDYVWRTGARLNLPLAWLPDRIAGGRFALEEPPSRPSDWVGDVLRQARIFAQRLEHMPSLDREDVQLLWRHALEWTAENMLAGFAGIKGRCTIMGRAAMSLDLQQVSNGLQMVVPQVVGGGLSVPDHLRIVDNYVKAFYIPWGEELQHWAQTHPEYTRQQTAALLAAIAESNGIRRRDRVAALAEIQGELAMA